jgi:hypothetical protein
MPPRRPSITPVRKVPLRITGGTRTFGIDPVGLKPHPLQAPTYRQSQVEVILPPTGMDHLSPELAGELGCQLRGDYVAAAANVGTQGGQKLSRLSTQVTPALNQSGADFERRPLPARMDRSHATIGGIHHEKRNAIGCSNPHCEPGSVGPDSIGFRLKPGSRNRQRIGRPDQPISVNLPNSPDGGARDPKLARQTAEVLLHPLLGVSNPKSEVQGGPGSGRDPPRS